MKRTYNYTEIKTRDAKLYEISGSTISTTGVSIEYIKILIVTFIVFNLVGIAICILGGKNYYNPIVTTPSLNLKLGFLIVMVGGPLGVSLALKYIKIQNYTLLEFLISYLKKKEEIDIKMNKIKCMRYKQKGFVENVTNIKRRKT